MSITSAEMIPQKAGSSKPQLFSVISIVEFLEAVSDGLRQKAADGILEGLCKLNESHMPFRRWGCLQRSLSEVGCKLVRSLLPFCSLEKAAQAHLVLSISAWEKDARDLAVREINRAASIAEQAGSVLNKYLYKDIWISYSIIQGFDGCLRAASALLTKSNESEDIHRNTLKLLLCAMDQVPQKATFIRNLRAALKSLKEYI